MPAYVICPHCEHPAVLPMAVANRAYRCRQCNGLYILKFPESAPPAPPTREIPEPRRMKQAV